VAQQQQNTAEVAVCGKGGGVAKPKQLILQSYQPTVFTDSINYQTIGLSDYRPNPT